MPLLIVLIGVILLIFMIVKLKLNTFVALVITSFIVTLMLGLPLTKIPTTIETGIGGQLGHLAIIFGFGSMLGQLVSDAGGGYRIATTLIDKFGRRWIQVAVILASFIIGLALFFEVGLVVVLPIIFIIARELDMPLMYLGIPMAATLNVTHAFLPPHPAPTAISDILGASLGHVLRDHRRDSNHHHCRAGLQLVPPQGLPTGLPQEHRYFRFGRLQGIQARRDT